MVVEEALRSYTQEMHCNFHAGFGGVVAGSIALADLLDTVVGTHVGGTTAGDDAHFEYGNDAALVQYTAEG